MEHAFNKYHFSIPIFGQEIWVTDTLISFWIIAGVLIAVSLAVRLALPRFKAKPRGVQNVIETAVEMMGGMTEGSLPDKSGLDGWFFGVIAVLLLCNVSGMFGLRPPTADLSFTAAFAVTSFFLIHFMGITRAKRHYFKEYVTPNVVFLPIHLISEIAVPLSLSFRLFGNILGGFIIIELIYSMVPGFMRALTPVPFHFYFDMFASALQAYIFCILSMTFIKNKSVVEH
ncbi:MAG: F0F1 ATP synthase subunit A [Clostridiales bacterium]|jgi:F-type H+-transporting ATPase subunit a|nr:F0F1 ATP synthase subunit A [Clostridiales bacterium]